MAWLSEPKRLILTALRDNGDLVAGLDGVSSLPDQRRALSPNVLRALLRDGLIVKHTENHGTLMIPWTHYSITDVGRSALG